MTLAFVVNEGKNFFLCNNFETIAPYFIVIGLQKSRSDNVNCLDFS